jgi:putative peptide zinc metalloprotease protein
VPIVKSALPAGRRDPRVAGLRRSARIVVTAWVLCVIPLLLFTIGYLLLHLPAFERALWHSSRVQAHLISAAAAGHHYALAAIDTVSIVLLTLPGVGSLYIATRLARQVAALGRHWAADRPVRRLIAAGTGIAVIAALAAFWITQGQFSGW